MTRFGSRGNGASVSKMQAQFQLGFGTVTKYTERVLKALKDIVSSWISWPDTARRKEISQVMDAEGFPGCVGFIGGTTIPLSQKPALDGHLYFDRKKRYSINMQVICDDNKRITAMFVGYPGSCADSMVFENTAVYRNPANYFSKGQFLLADPAYSLTSNCIPAYTAPTSNLKENTEFNYCLARSRVRNEDCIGILKGRFASLQEMRQQIRNASDMGITIDWIVACCVLHNMLTHLGDQRNEPFVDKESEAPHVAENVMDETSKTFREAVKKITLETNYSNGVLPFKI